MMETLNITETIAGEAIVQRARGWIGTPYCHQASEKGAGTDCLGLIRGLWRELYGTEPEIPPSYTPDWNERHWSSRQKDVLLEAAHRHLIPSQKERPLAQGEVLIFRIDRFGPAKHCGVVSASDQFIHAYVGRAVCESWLNRWWYARIAGRFQFPGAVSWPS